MRVTDCRINHLKNPMGYRMNRTVFSWKVIEAKGKKQKSARIRAALDGEMEQIIYDSGWSESLDSLASRVDLKLEPRTRYYWQVSVKSDAGEEADSDVNWFETAKREEVWSGKWITCDSGKPRHPVFTKELDPKGRAEAARLYICGLGLYEAYLNGQRIGAEYLAPYSNDYNTWIQYQTYDITEEINQGGSLEVLLGNGWWKGRFGFNARNDEGFFGKDWKLIAEVHITYEDGSTEVIGTDESWEVKRSSLTFSNIYDGEHADDTLEEIQPSPALLDPDPPKGKLTERMSTPVQIREEITPVELIKTPAGETVLDLGQNFAGIFKLHVNLPRGEKVHLKFGEILQNGNFYRDNLRTAKAEYCYISDGREKDLIPHFTYYGYRYVLVEGIPDLRKEDFTGLALYSELTKAGTLETGNALVNKLISNTRWGLKSNFLDVPTDCPQRDERMGWTGDTQVFCATASFLEESYAFYAKYLYDCAQEQKVLGGMVPDVVPSVGHAGEGSSVWGDAACIIPWTLYQFYGDLSILEEQYESMKSWVEFIRKTDGDDFGWRRHFHYGDWLALDNPKGGTDEVKGGTDDGFIASIYYGNSARILADTAALLGYGKDEKEYRQLAEQIFHDTVEEYYSSTGRCCVNTQTGYILTLLHGLSKNPEMVRLMLRQNFKDHDYKLQTGFTGTPLLCNVLSDQGMEDLAYRLLLNEEYPGWLHEIKLGATTIWERWNSVEEDGSISSTGMNSLNHYSYGSIVEWIFRHVAGLNPVQEHPGFREALLTPVPNWKLKSAAAEYDSPAGVYKSAWEVTDANQVKIKVSIPFGATARLRLYKAVPETFEDRENPMFARVEDGICYLEAGDYEVIYQTSESLRKILNSYMPVQELMANPEAAAVLTQVSPGIAQMPGNMKSMSLRQITERYGNPQMAAMLDGLDEALAKIGE